MRTRLDTMIENGFQIRDATAADKAGQRYLADDKASPNVLALCMKDHCRNNVRNWPTRQLVAPPGAKGYDYCRQGSRDGEAAEYGLMLWGGTLVR